MPRFRILALGGLLLLMTGCIWLRLLDLKNQFAEFDRYITVIPGDGIELRFKEPVLLADDLDTLLRGQPTAALPLLDDGEVRVYAFAHIPSILGPDPIGSEGALTILAVLRHDRLESITLPKEVFRVVPRDLALRALRAFGQAKVDTSNRSAQVQVDAVAGTIPERQAIIGLFGNPNKIDPLLGKLGTPIQERLVWRYVLQGQPPEIPPVQAAIAFVFPGNSAIPNQFQAIIGGMWLRLDLSVVTAPPAEKK